jgi:hypothetical protein
MSVAQFLRVCSKSQCVYMGKQCVYMGKRRHRSNSPIFTRGTLPRRRDAQRLPQCLRATNCDKLRDLRLRRCRSPSPCSDAYFPQLSCCTPPPGDQNQCLSSPSVLVANTCCWLPIRIALESLATPVPQVSACIPCFLSRLSAGAFSLPARSSGACAC